MKRQSTDESGGTTGLGPFSILRRTWRQAILYAVVTRIMVATILLPCLGFALRLALDTGGRAALSDQEIVFFALSPLGLVVIIILGGFWLGVAFIEQAGLMTIAHAAVDGNRLTWFGVLRHVVRRLPGILLLGSHLLARILVMAAPFLVLSGAIFWILLTDHDINFYLGEKPPEFLWAAALIGILLLALLVILTIKCMGWMWALPFLLFARLGASQAIRRSVETTRGYRWRLFAWVLLWIAGGAMLSLVSTWIMGTMGGWVVPMVADSLYLLSFTIGTLGLLAILLNFCISLLAAALFACVITRSYRRHSGAESLTDMPVASQIQDSVKQATFRVSPRLILGGLGLALVGALLLANLIISKVESDNDALIIAHRGASADAPENTIAAVREAVRQEADFVEIDVQETADGEVVVFHDSDFMKTAGNPLKIWDATLEQARQIDIGSWFDKKFAAERIPTLAEVLRECKGRAHVNIELKYYGHDQQLDQRVIKIVESLEMKDEVVIMSLNFDKLAAARKLRPDWTYGFLKSVSLGDSEEFDVDFLAINAGRANRRLVRSIRESGRDVYVWTVNDALTMLSMLSRGVDGLITDRPALARRVLEMRKDLSPAERLLISLGAEVGVFDPGKWLLEEETKDEE